jgi:hypothetical protein
VLVAQRLVERKRVGIDRGRIGIEDKGHENILPWAGWRIRRLVRWRNVSRLVAGR